MKTLLIGLSVLALILYIDWKFIRKIFKLASQAGEENSENKLKGIVVDVVTKDIYVPEMEKFVQSEEFRALLREYEGESLDQELKKKIEKSYRAYYHIEKV